MVSILKAKKLLQLIFICICVWLCVLQKTMGHAGFSSSYKSFQDNMVSMYKNWFPRAALKKIRDQSCSPEQRLAKQQADNLKWQQNMFHKMVHAMGMYKEAIISHDQLLATKTHVLDSLVASPSQAEPPAIIRDKLQFLQELLYANCISEDEYHEWKRPLLMRLAVQDAQIHSKDIVLPSQKCCGTATNTTITAPVRAPVVTVSIEPLPSTDGSSSIAGIHQRPQSEIETETETEWSVVDFNDQEQPQHDYGHGVPLLNNPSSSHINIVAAADDKNVKKTPMKQIMSRFGLTPAKGREANNVIPFTIDLQAGTGTHTNRVLSAHTNGIATAPVSIDARDSFKENPFWQVTATNEASSKSKEAKNSASVENHGAYKRGATRARVKKALNQLFSREGYADQQQQQEADEAARGGMVSDSDSDVEVQPLKAKPIIKSWRLDFFKPSKTPDKHDDNNNNDDAYVPQQNAKAKHDSPPLKLVPNPVGMGPNTKNMKKKLNSDGTPTDFFIDKVLGDNIKSELSRIRSEMNNSTGVQNFTNEQIEAIATKLPVDKNELKKFLPQTWCDKHGDMVLDVIRREFKDHVGDMDNRRKNSWEKRNRNFGCNKGLFGISDMGSPPVHSQAKKLATPSNLDHEKDSARLLNDENSQPNLIDYTSPASKAQDRKLSKSGQIKALRFSPVDQSGFSSGHSRMVNSNSAKPVSCSNLSRDRYQQMEHH